MDFTKEKILPQFIYKFKLPDEIHLKAKKLVKKYDWEGRPNRNEIIYHGKSSVGLDYFFSKEDNFGLISYLNKCLYEIKKDLSWDEVENLEVSLIWANKSTKGQWHHGHKHDWSILSGIVYLEGETGKTWFSTESLFMEAERRWWLRYENTNCQDLVHQHEPEPGTVIIFPSQLFHSVDEVKEDEPRYTIAFNTFPNEVVGAPHRLAGFKSNLKLD
jgi:uncharacterized protein (TIGR02466 family)